MRQTLSIEIDLAPANISHRTYQHADIRMNGKIAHLKSRVGNSAVVLPRPSLLRPVPYCHCADSHNRPNVNEIRIEQLCQSSTPNTVRKSLTASPACPAQ